MKSLLVFLMFAIALPVMAQVDVAGIVIDKENSEPLAGASVMVKGPDGKIKKFATTKADGKFAMSLPEVTGHRLEVTMMGFAKESVPLDSVSFPLTVSLSEGAIQLKEVAVKADRIREQGDTISYNVGSFAQQQDRSIGDVLRRMPGIDVAKSGKIQYQGEDINKFYIEGSDLLGGKYGVATNGISHEDVCRCSPMPANQNISTISACGLTRCHRHPKAKNNYNKSLWLHA